jgi:hypothetical protein
MARSCTFIAVGDISTLSAPRSARPSPSPSRASWRASSGEIARLPD